MKEVVYIHKSNVFPCYSVPMRDYLSSKGIRYEIVGLHPESKNMFWVYIKTNKLCECLQEWSGK